MPTVASATFIPLGTPRIGTIDLDCTLSETHTWRSAVTRVPVESGADRAQHIQDQPFQLKIEAVISDRPVNHRKQQAALGRAIAQSAVTGYFSSIPGLLALKNQAYEKVNGAYAQNIAGNLAGADALASTAVAAATSFGPPDEYSAIDKLMVALSRLLELKDSHTPFDYVSPLGLVQNLVFEGLELPIGQESDLLFRASLVEFVETGLTRTQSLAVGQVDASSDPANIGSRTTITTAIPGLTNVSIGP